MDAVYSIVDQAQVLLLVAVVTVYVVVVFFFFGLRGQSSANTQPTSEFLSQLKQYPKKTAPPPKKSVASKPVKRQQPTTAAAVDKNKGHPAGADRQPAAPTKGAGNTGTNKTLHDFVAHDEVNEDWMTVTSRRRKKPDNDVKKVSGQQDDAGAKVNKKTTTKKTAKQSGPTEVPTAVAAVPPASAKPTERKQKADNPKPSVKVQTPNKVQLANGQKKPRPNKPPKADLKQ